MTYGELEHESVYNDHARAEIERIETIKDNYEFHIIHYIRYLRENQRSISFNSITDYYKELKSGDYSISTINTRRFAVKNRVQHICDIDKISLEGLAQINAFFIRLNKSQETSGAKRREKIPEIIYEGEYKLLIDNASDRTKLFIEFIWATGCTVSEMINIEVKDCGLDAGRVYIKIAKGKKERINFIKIDLFKDIQTTFKGQTLLFETNSGLLYGRTYPSQEIKKLGKKILNRKISAITIRSSRAALLIRKTHKLSAVAKYLGISNPGYLLRYDLQELTDKELEDNI